MRKLCSWRRSAMYSAIVALALIPTTSSSVAHASFPGANGVLAFDVYRDTTSVGNETCSSLNCQIVRIFSLKPDSRKASRVPTCPGRECQDRHPAWSRDGRKMAFMRQVFLEPGNAEPTRHDLGVFSPGRGAIRVLEQDAAVPAWGPGGSLVFVRGTRLIVRSPEGELQTQRTGAGIPNTPDWSSRGTIAYTRRLDNGGAAIFTLRTGAAPRKLVSDALNPSWSPDGRKIAFQRLSKPGLYIVSAKRGRCRRVGTVSGKAPAWSPDGRWIAFHRGRSIYAVRPNGSRLHRLYTLREPGTLNHLAWQPRPHGG